MDYAAYYNLEQYLERTVGPRFRDSGKLSAFDFFSIVIWKANRAKTKIAGKLLGHGFKSLDEAVGQLGRDLRGTEGPKERLQTLVVTWHFRLPMATAILAILYPEEFTVYDIRVCNELGSFHRLANRVNFESIWDGYLGFLQAVRDAGPAGASLREKDRFLWGRNAARQLRDDIRRSFTKTE